MLVSIFMPFFNEEEIIEVSVNKTLEFLKKLQFEFEVFLIDDGSSDCSSQIAQRLARNSQILKYIRYDNGPTRRENLAKSFILARGEIILFMDIDLATNLLCLRDLIKAIQDGYDIVIGDRYHPESKIKRRIIRIFISLIYNKFISLFFGTHIRDHECGFKAFKKDVILKLVDEMGYDSSFRRGISWDTELIVRALKYNYKIKIIHIIWKERKKTSLNFKQEIKMVPYVLKLRSRI